MLACLFVFQCSRIYITEKPVVQTHVLLSKRFDNVIIKVVRICLVRMNIIFKCLLSIILILKMCFRCITKSSGGANCCMPASGDVMRHFGHSMFIFQSPPNPPRFSILKLECLLLIGHWVAKILVISPHQMRCVCVCVSTLGYQP